MKNTWRYVSIPEMGEFLSPFSSVQYRAIGFTGAFGRSERRNLFGRVDGAIFDSIVPDRCKYIIVGFAKK